MDYGELNKKTLNHSGSIPNMESTLEKIASCRYRLLPHVPCRDTQPRRPAATHAPTAPLTAEQLYVVAAALLADDGESFVHHHPPGADCGKHTRATAQCTRPVACHTPRAHPRLGCGRWHTSTRA